jgi:FG-GAP repeat
VTSRKHGIATRFALGWIASVAFLLLAGGALATPVAAASSPQSASQHAVTKTLTSPNSSPEGSFGSWAVASGNFIVVAAYNETANGYAGAGHFYIFNIETGALITTLTSPNAQANGGFGEAVAAIGNIVVVGAPFEAAEGYAGAGHAYVYLMAPPF